jgi:hypothetical protein
VEVKRNQAAFHIVCCTTGTKYKDLAFKKKIYEVWRLETWKQALTKEYEIQWKIQGPFIQRRFGEGVETYIFFYLSLYGGYIYSFELRFALHTM